MTSEVSAFDVIEQRWLSQERGETLNEVDSYFAIRIKQILAQEVNSIFPDPIVQPVPGIGIRRTEDGLAFLCSYMASDKSDPEGPTALFMLAITKEGIFVLPK